MTPVCATCRQRPATWTATLRNESWPVCGRCKEQAERLTVVTHQPLAAQ